jgi:DNA-binding GntR family transcriptional regulator
VRASNTDIAYEFIREKILTREYAPGHHLMTEDLSEAIGVSRTPIRDALRKLESDGFVIIKPREGASVKTMDFEEFRQICEVRLALESYASGLAAVNRTPRDMQVIKAAFDSMCRINSKNWAKNDEATLMEKLAEEDVRFHVAIITASKNALLKKEILRLHLINRIVSSPTPAFQSLSKKDREDRRLLVLGFHEDILKAIESGDGTKARSAMEFHISELIDHNLKSLDQGGQSSASKSLTDEELIYRA